METLGKLQILSLCCPYLLCRCLPCCCLRCNCIHCSWIGFFVFVVFVFPLTLSLSVNASCPRRWVMAAIVQQLFCLDCCFATLVKNHRQFLSEASAIYVHYMQYVQYMQYMQLSNSFFAQIAALPLSSKTTVSFSLEPVQLYARSSCPRLLC